MDLVTIDPGKRTVGYSVFQNNVLVHAGLIQYNIIEGFELIAQSYKPRLTVIEKPKVYPFRHWKGDPNDLIDVAVTVGMAAAIFKKFELVLPQDWKGQRPKDVDNQYTMSLLSKIEAQRIHHYPKSKLHNVIDAIGIGLWKVGRRK